MRRVPRTLVIPFLAGGGFGWIAGLAAIASRGSVDFGSVRLEGMAGLAAISALLALIGLLVGLTCMLLARAITDAAKGDRRT